MSLQILTGDCVELMRGTADESVQCCVTSPPYWGLRDYQMAGQIGLEPTFAEWLARMRGVFSEVWRVLKPNGVAWVNMGDSYATGTTSDRKPTARGKHGYWENPAVNKRIDARDIGLKPKNLIGQPWRLAFALQEDGWYLRSDIIWHKPNPMPESVTDRPTKSHEYIFLLSKSEHYYYDAEAIKEPSSPDSHARIARGRNVGYHAPGQSPQSGIAAMRAPGVNPKANHNGSNGSKQNASFTAAIAELVPDRNKRSVWTVPTYGFPEAHFATFPPDLIKPCVMAGTKPGDVVLDPFGGSGTTAMVALELGRSAILCELNPAYAQLARERCNITWGLPL